MSLDKLVAKIKAIYGESCVSLCEKYGYELHFSGMTVRCFESLGKLIWVTKLIELPLEQQQRLEVLKHYLELSLAYIKTYPIALTIDDAYLNIHRKLDILHVDYAIFEETLENLFNAREFYTENNLSGNEVFRGIFA